MSKKIQKKNIGFTLVETLVAISILSLSILATFTAVQNGLQTSITAKDQIVAYYLAQEAMEYVKNIRDENALNSLDGSSVNWLTGLVVTSGGGSGPCDFGKTCTIDSALKVVTACSAGFGTCPNLRQDTSTGLYGYTSSWPASNYKREIQFTNVVSNYEVKVTINITWNTRGTSKTFQVSQLLFNRE